MISLLRGKIIEVGPQTISVDLGAIGFEVLVSKPDSFGLGDSVELFVCEIQTQDDRYLVGFSSLEEKKAFLSLTSVKGIGAKTAMAALSSTTPEALFAAIQRGDAAYLKKLSAIGPKAASQIILDLRGKLVPIPEKVKKADRYPGVRSALRNLDFRVKEIEDAITSLPDDMTEEAALKAALRKLAKGKSTSHV